MKEVKKLNIALLGESSTQFYRRYLSKILLKDGIAHSFYESEYDSIDFEVLDINSGLYQSNPQFTIIYLSVFNLYNKFGSTDIQQRATFSVRELSRIENYISHIGKHTKTTIILNNYPVFKDPVFSNYGSKIDSSWSYQLQKINLGLSEISQKYKQVFIQDMMGFSAMKGFNYLFDPRLLVRADIITSLEFLQELTEDMANLLKTLTGKFNKCLILDLDNTMWGGIIGDDGIENIEVGELGIGKAFSFLQKWAKELHDRGIILCVCSKNTEEIALEPFECHQDMILRKDHIAVFVANWENKADNIRYIQSVLNIGFDSMVFLDDNPFERNLVRKNIPEITVPELPEDPADYISFILNTTLFETASYSHNDTTRTRQYQQEALRSKNAQNFSSIEDYLVDLNMVAKIEPFNAFNTPRVAQLSQRSNQFNLRTIRYNEEDIRHFIQAKNYETMAVSLHDKYGDYGIISIINLEFENQQAFIDTWIMSCRVLKRNVEEFVLNKIVAVCKKHNIEQLVGEYLPTKKNKIVANHYLDLGFSDLGKGKWSLDCASYKEKKTHITHAHLEKSVNEVTTE